MHRTESNGQSRFSPGIMAGILILLASLATGPSCSDEEIMVASPGAMYYSDIRYVFDVKCLNAGCHSGDTPAAGLGMANYEDILRGSENGSVVTPGNPETSLLYRTMAYTGAPEMPIGERLPQPLVDSVGRWIRDGLFENR